MGVRAGRNLGFQHFFDVGAGDPKSIIKAFIIGIFQLRLTVVLAWQAAKIRGGVLGKFWPCTGRTWAGRLAMCCRRFHGCDVWRDHRHNHSFQIDPMHTPGPDGQSPTSGSAGMGGHV
jgi:hypothetical protein